MNPSDAGRRHSSRQTVADCPSPLRGQWPDCIGRYVTDPCHMRRDIAMQVPARAGTAGTVSERWVSDFSNARTGTRLKSLGRQRTISGTTFVDDLTLAVTGWDSMLNLWDLEGDQLHCASRGP